MTISSICGLQRAYQGEAVAERYIDARFASELHRLLHERQSSLLRQLIRRVHPTRVLEIAPGPGRLTRELHPTGILACLEYNEGMIERGRGSCGRGASWVRGNGFQLPFAQGFDLVYSFRFVRHFHREDRARLYAEIRRILVPGGYFLMDAVNEQLSAPFRNAVPDDYPIYDELYRPEQLCVELAMAGLHPLELEPVQKFYPWQYRSQVLLGPRANWLNRLVIRGLEWLPKGDGLEWIVTCRRG